MSKFNSILFLQFFSSALFFVSNSVWDSAIFYEQLFSYIMVNGIIVTGQHVSLLIIISLYLDNFTQFE